MPENHAAIIKSDISVWSAKGLSKIILPTLAVLQLL